MTIVKQGDFIEVEYTGSFPNGKVFDTNDPVKFEEWHKHAHGHDHEHEHDIKPLLVIVGEKQLIKGFDEALPGKEVGKTYKIEIPSEKAYGAKDSKLIRTLKMDLFTKNKMNPYPGLQINADGLVGTVRSVTGGRVSVDFNHPLAGRDLVFEFKILKIIEDEKVKLKAIIEKTIFMREDMYDLEVNGENVIINSGLDVPEQIQKILKDKVIKILPKIKTVEFKKKAITQE